MAQGSISIQPRPVNAKLTILDIEGELTGNGEEILMDAYTAASASGAKTIGLNFDDLEYMNSSGIGLLVTLLIRGPAQQADAPGHRTQRPLPADLRTNAPQRSHPLLRDRGGRAQLPHLSQHRSVVRISAGDLGNKASEFTFEIAAA